MSSPSQPRIPEIAQGPGGLWVPESAAERTAIREQLERMLANPLFANSRRSAKLLRYVVEHTLDGRADYLKERTLGVEVFQRVPDYDTNRDPVVRTTAVEIRKRIAQYYSESRRDSEIRIALPAGNYQPEFRLPADWPPPAVAAGATALPAAPADRHPAAQAGGWIYGWKVHVAALLIALTVGAIAGIALWTKPWVAPGALDRFWEPVLKSRGPVLLLIGGIRLTEAPSAAPAKPISILDLQREEHVAFADATALSRMIGILASKGKPHHTRRQALAKLDDLRDGPTVLIGAFNNDWTLRLAAQWRFYFDRDPVSHDAWIADRENPANRGWLVHQASPYAKVPEDFALVSRIMDPTTGQLTVMVAGISKYGTAAAGEFLSDPVYLEEVARTAPKYWDRKNLQIVISTRLVGESSGQPKVVATHFW